jgi:hypothetical protein
MPTGMLPLNKLFPTRVLGMMRLCNRFKSVSFSLPQQNEPPEEFSPQPRHQ